MNTVLTKIIPFIFLGLVILMLLYISSRLRTHFHLQSKWGVIAGVTVTIIGSLALIMGAVKSTSTVIGGLSIVGGYVLVFSFYLFVFLLVIQLLQPVLKTPNAVGGWIAIVLALIPTVIGAVQASYFKVNEVTVPISKLNSNLKIMLISDVHLGHHRGKDYLIKIVEETNKRNPDIILLAGDLMDAEVALFPELLQPLSDFKAPVYYVGGNHEKEINEEKAIQLIMENGVQVLHNEVIDTLGIQLIGLDYMKPDEHTFDMHPSENKQTIEEVLGKMQWDNNKPVILMHHSPVGVQYAKKAGVDLMVAGHTHAGQVFPFTHLANLLFEFNKGIYKEDKTTVLVSQGAGTFLSRLRLGSENEINLVHLVLEK